MKDSLLKEGIFTLCQNDEKIEKLISPRKEEIISLLERYIKEIELFNPAYGLVAAADREELVIKHILDSIAPLGLLSRLSAEAGETGGGLKIADAGSGAGLPGIPLAICLPDCEFTLIERMGRRAGFLCSTKAVLELSNVSIEENELEKVKSGKFNLITFRAFKPLDPKLLKTLFNACAKGGIIAAYKGRLERTEMEMANIKTECPNRETISYKVPFLDEERHLLIIKTA